MNKKFWLNSPFINEITLLTQCEATNYRFDRLRLKTLPALRSRRRKEGLVEIVYRKIWPASPTGQSMAIRILLQPESTICNKLSRFFFLSRSRETYDRDRDRERRGGGREQEEVDRAHCSQSWNLSLFPASPSPDEFVRHRKFDERRRETRSIPSIYDHPLRRYLFVYGPTETRSIRLFHPRTRNQTCNLPQIRKIYLP